MTSGHKLIAVQKQVVTSSPDSDSAAPLTNDATPSELESADQPSMWLRALPGLPAECEVSTPVVSVIGCNTGSCRTVMSAQQLPCA